MLQKGIGPAGRGEAGVQLGGEPIPNTTAKLMQQPAGSCMRVKQSLSAVELFAPWSGAEERLLRERIHRARDIAQARAMRSTHEGARSLYWIAADLASRWVFARAPIDDLNEIIAALTYLFLVAGKIERLEVCHD